MSGWKEEWVGRMCDIWVEGSSKSSCFLLPVVLSVSSLFASIDALSSCFIDLS